MIKLNYTYGFEKNTANIAANDEIHTSWTNPLEARLPNAPSLKIFSLYGWGKETERAYWYKLPDVTVDKTVEVNDGMEEPTPFIDSEVTVIEEDQPEVHKGVRLGEGDGTVSLLSLGGMKHGWTLPKYNPAGCQHVVHEFLRKSLSRHFLY